MDISTSGPGAVPAPGVSVSLGYASAVADAGGAGPDLLLAGDRRLPFEEVRGLWDRVIGASGDPAAGLRVGADLRPPALDVLGHVVLGCATLGEAAEAAVRYHRLVSEAGEIALVRGRTLSRVVYRPTVAPGAMRPQQVEAVVVGMVSAARWLAGPTWTPAAVTFTHPCGSERLGYERVLGCPVAFGAADNALTVPTADLDLRRVVVDQGLASLQRAYADRLLADLTGPAAVPQRLRRWLAGVPLEGVGFADAQATSRLGGRALRRVLREHGTSWRVLLDEARHTRARQLLETTDLTTDRVARAVGLSGAAALGHAFVRWQGVSPGAYRRTRRTGAAGGAPAS
ncbi:AraC family transcriptional regulator [Kitasatospora sp. MBT63]|uniref:AraC family transcriptional regulator n=1 Tax=Kitasatospora sp. MBT63 TaxID=1444768 RepID=UPI000539E6BF|nr:AraC family transcriptional regulator [Kitasatospora sp. MBT63]